jgi:hypothetical protein
MFLAPASSGADAFIKGKAFARNIFEYGKQRTGRHSLAVFPSGKVIAISKSAEFSNVLKEFFKALQIAMHYQVVGLYRLKLTELVTGDETPMNHQVSKGMNMQEATAGLINPTDQPQEGAFAGSVVTNQGDTLAMVHENIERPQGLNRGTAEIPAQLATRHGAQQAGAEAAHLADRIGSDTFQGFHRGECHRHGPRQPHIEIIHPATKYRSIIPPAISEFSGPWLIDTSQRSPATQWGSGNGGAWSHETLGLSHQTKPRRLRPSGSDCRKSIRSTDDAGLDKIEA